MNEQYLKAAGLASLLIVIPLGAAAWAFADARGALRASLPSTIEGRRPLAVNAARPRRRLARHLYWALLGLSAGVVALSLMRSDVSTASGLRALAIYLFAAALAGAAPWRPILGPLAYVIVSYALPREDAVTVALINAGADSMLAALSAAALVVSSVELGRAPDAPRGAAVGALLAFSLWTGVAVFAAMANGHPVSEALCHRTARVIQTVVLFLISYYAKPRSSELKLLVAAIAGMLIVRTVRFTDGVRLEQNLAALIAITVPWTVALAWAGRNWLVRLGGAMLALCLAALVMVIANRGAILGLTASAATVWVVTPWKWRIVAACTPAFILAVLVLPSTTLGERIDAVYAQDQLDLSAVSRLEFWSFGLDLARQNPVFGVGPENFAHYVSEAIGLEGANLGAHNSLVDVVAETGFPGAILFIAFWMFASHALLMAFSRLTLDPLRPFYLGSLASVWAFLVTGFFLSLASLTFVYILTGLSLGLTAVGMAGALALQSASARLPRRALGRSELDLATLCYAGFVVIGSLTPFEIEAVGLADAGRRFAAMRWWPPDFSSRVDSVSNMTLFVPLGFLFMGSLTCDATSSVRRVVAAFCVVLGTVGFGASIEYLQCWFPQRTTSSNDVAAQLIGTLAGIALWLVTGQWAVDRWRAWRVGRADLSALEKAAMWYGGGLVLWWCWPLELSLHPVDLYHKYRDGYWRLYYLDDYLTPLAGGTYSALALLLLPAPIGWFLSSAWRRQSELHRSWRHVLPLAAVRALGLEMVRLMTYGQMATGDQALLTFTSMLLGAALHRWWAARLPAAAVAA